VLVEIRRYTLKPGRSEEFLSWFDEEVRPAMEEAGMRILGMFSAVEDPDVFIYLRGFGSAAERDRLTDAFYQSPVWTERMRARALDMELDYQVELVRSTPGSPI
jgi:hypothetical protein